MDLNVISENSKIRQIEGIIDMQKANGNINVRQMANVAKSLDSGLYNGKANTPQKSKKLRYKKKINPSPDLSWPSDSDITVLRMKLCLQQAVKKEVGNLIPGDGLHQPDSSSMINLATLMVHSQSPSKHSLSIEEYLLPINSWEQTIMSASKKSEKKEINRGSLSRDLQTGQVIYGVDNCNCPHGERYFNDENFIFSNNIKSKVARFLRLYFCPCCTCLYKLENMQNEPSSYFPKKVTFMDGKIS